MSNSPVDFLYSKIYSNFKILDNLFFEWSWQYGEDGSSETINADKDYS